METGRQGGALSTCCRSLCSAKAPPRAAAVGAGRPGNWLSPKLPGLPVPPGIGEPAAAGARACVRSLLVGLVLRWQDPGKAGEGRLHLRLARVPTLACTPQGP